MKKTIKKKKQVTSMEDAEAIQQLQERMDMLELRMKAHGLKEAKATKSEIKAIQEGHQEIVAGKGIPLDKLLKRLNRK